MSADYPSDDDLKRIEEWSHDNFAGLFAFVRSLWWQADWGWSEGTDGDDAEPVYFVSTGGWSGNESLIEAMQDNHVFWMLHWIQTRRGGHYIFRRPQRLVYYAPPENEPGE